jgi:hypothetical protein
MKTRKERKLHVTMRNSEIGNEQGRESEILPRDKSCKLFWRKQATRRLMRSGDEGGPLSGHNDICSALSSWGGGSHCIQLCIR